MKKEKRLSIIKQVIQDNEIKTQEQLVEELSKQGLHITQATISRDIRELSLVKYPSRTGGTKYGFIGEHKYNDTMKLRKKMQDALLNIERIEYFIILRVLPGHAHSFGAILDELEWEEKAATICGNDTCMIICRSIVQAEVLEERLRSVANL